MVTFLGLWPASLLKAALIKNYLFYLYTAIIRGDTIAHQSIAATWTIRVMASPIEYALSFLGFVFGMYVWCRRKQTIAAPFVMYLFLILLATMKMRVPMPTYTSSLTAVGLATAALSIIILCRDKKAWLGIGILFACCVALFAQLRFVYIPRQLEQLSASSKSAVISFIRNEHPRKLLVSRSMTPILHYYCREVKTDSYLPEFFAGGGEDEREIEEYLLNNSDYSGVLYSGTKIDFIRAEIAGRYASEEIPLSATADERCIYFRLVPKVQTVPHG